jgi:hypothetical protein
VKFIQCILDFVGDNAEALIALSALGLAIWQGIVQRLHNRLSVKPHLMFDRITQNHSPQIQIFLTNKGIGPAVITKFLISLDGKEVDVSPQSVWNNILGQLQILAVWGGGKIYFAGEAISAGGNEKIFAMKTTHAETDPGFSTDDAFKELDRLQIEVKYESIYGDKFIEYLTKH